MSSHKKRVAAGTDGEYTPIEQQKNQAPPKLERKSGPVSKLQEADLDAIAKNLFQTVQGVNHDDKCPHGIPFYACMGCSH